MPFVLIVAGVVLLIAAIRGDACGQVQCHELLFYLLANDFTGPNNFIFWFLSILAIGALGYVPKLKPLSDGLLILVIVVLFFRKDRGFFDMFNKQIASTTQAKPAITAQNMFGQLGIVNVGAGGINANIGLPGGGQIGVGTGGVGVTLPPITVGGNRGGLPPIGGQQGGPIITF